MPWHTDRGGASVNAADVLGFPWSGQCPLSGQPFFKSVLLSLEGDDLVFQGFRSSTAENLLTRNYLMAWSKIVHIFQVYGWKDTSKGLGLPLTCAWAFINLAGTFLEMGSEINSYRYDHEILAWESRLEKLRLSNVAFQVRQNSLNLLTEALMKCRAAPGLLGILSPLKVLNVTCSPWKCLDEENVLT